MTYFIVSIVFFTFLLSPNIRVLFLSGKAMIFDIIKSKIHFASITTIISIWRWAVDKLLFWKIYFDISVNAVSTFESLSSRKSPTWSAYTLTFDRRDITSGDPINIISNLFVSKFIVLSRSWKSIYFLCWLIWMSFKVDLNKLLFCEISKGIES